MIFLIFSLRIIFLNIFREPKKRSMWLRIWFDSLEEVEGSDPWALAFNEEEEKKEVEVKK